jgi:hypothetical protein
MKVMEAFSLQLVHGASKIMVESKRTKTMISMMKRENE